LGNITHSTLTWKATSSPPKEEKARKRKKVKTVMAFSLWVGGTGDRAGVIHGGRCEV